MDVILDNKIDATLTRRVKLGDGKQDGNPVAGWIIIVGWMRWMDDDGGERSRGSGEGG